MHTRTSTIAVSHWNIGDFEGGSTVIPQTGNPATGLHGETPSIDSIYSRPGSVPVNDVDPFFGMATPEATRERFTYLVVTDLIKKGVINSNIPRVSTTLSIIDAFDGLMNNAQTAAKIYSAIQVDSANEDYSYPETSKVILQALTEKFGPVLAQELLFAIAARSPLAGGVLAILGPPFIAAAAHDIPKLIKRGREIIENGYDPRQDPEYAWIRMQKDAATQFSEGAKTAMNKFGDYMSRADSELSWIAENIGKGIITNGSKRVFEGLRELFKFIGKFAN